MSDTRGASLGASFTGASVGTTESGTTTTESGAGFQVEGMYGIKNRFAACQLQRVVGLSRALTPPCSPTV
jgi:hypothetical protein